MRTAVPGDQARPLYVVWELTLACDLSCGHCGSRAGRPRTSELSTEEALGVVRQLAELGTREITLIGGEAYLRDDWTLIAQAVVSHGMRAGLTSGGRGLDRERALAAKRAGVDSVSISLDGLEAAHDRQRGVRGSFVAGLSALAELRDAGVGFTVNTQLNRLSLPDLERLFDLLVTEGVQGWQVQLTVPMGRAADRPEWLLEPWDLLDLYPRLAALATRGREHGVVFWPANNIGYYGPYEALLRNRGSEGDRIWQGCPAGTYALGIESDGSIKGCPSLPTQSYVGGNVRERSLRSIWDETRELRYTRDRTLDELWGFCQSCYYRDECRAGCTWTAHSFFGRPGNNPYCHHRALEHERLGVRETFVQSETAPGLPFDHGRFEIAVVSADAATAVRRLPLVE